MANQDSAFPIKREENCSEARSILTVAEALKKIPSMENVALLPIFKSISDTAYIVMLYYPALSEPRDWGASSIGL